MLLKGSCVFELNVIMSFHVIHFRGRRFRYRGWRRTMIFTDGSHPYITHRQSKCFNLTAKGKLTIPTHNWQEWKPSHLRTLWSIL